MTVYLVRRTPPDHQVRFTDSQASNFIPFQFEGFLEESKPGIDLHHRHVQPSGVAEPEMDKIILW